MEHDKLVWQGDSATKFTTHFELKREMHYSHWQHLLLIL